MATRNAPVITPVPAPLTSREERDAYDYYFTEFSRQRGQKLSPRTLQIYGLSVRLLVEFIDRHNNEPVVDRYGRKRFKEQHEKWSLDPCYWSKGLFFTYGEYLMYRHVTKAGRPLSQITRNTYFRGIQAFCTWVQEEYELPKHPMDGFELPKVVYRDKPTLSNDDFHRLVQAAQLGENALRDVALLYLLLDTAVRRSEALTLKYNAIDWHQRFIRVMGKGGVERTVPVSEVALKMLSSYNAVREGTGDAFFLTEHGTNLTVTSFTEIIRRLERRSGVKANPHMFRHTFATRTAQNGIGAFHLQHILGHKTLEITLRYIHMNDKDRQKAHDQYGPFASSS